VATALAEAPRADNTESTTVRAHVSAAGGKPGFINETLGRSRGGFITGNIDAVA
jgi:hypothetical protein